MSKTLKPERDGSEAELRSFGRRRGRKLSPRQDALLADVLPRVGLDLTLPAPEPLSQLFAVPVREIWLEIGFGGGEHLREQARRHPDVGFIGAEPFVDGVVKVLDRIAVDEIANIRLYPDDVRDVLRWLPPASVDRVFILFPDPWPKARHIKRRLVNPQLMEQLARVMRPGTELCIATDIPDYARTILLAQRASSAFVWPVDSAKNWQLRRNDWVETRYETKAIAAGRRCTYLNFHRP
ncbi:MAG: tRNA (guanine(46)-N(7))-methyltransferase TrmB [Pseudomonadota bacterium]